jgi:linalool dehydratase/isomerase-like protein
VFQICNQVPILGFRLHDHLYGGQLAREVTTGYLDAWERFGAGLLRHADTYTNPQWENGGLYYPRRDETVDEAGKFVAVPPIVSNATFPYARLNVADGLRTLYERPWTDRERARPALTEIGGQLDVRRAWYHEGLRRLRLRISPMHGLASTTADLTVSRVWGPDEWTLLVDGAPVAHSDAGHVVVHPDGQRLAPRRVEDAVAFSLDVHGRADIDIVWGRA